jgi:hypothetical protein
MRDYIQALDEPEVTYTDETHQVNVRVDNTMAAALDAIGERMKLSRTATARFILLNSIYDALAEVGLQIGADADGNLRPMTNEEQLDILARAAEARASDQ